MSDEKPLKEWTYKQSLVIAWLALPKAERDPKTQGELAVKVGVHETTISDWKRLPGWWDAVNEIARDNVREIVADVMGTIKREAVKGNLPYVNMVLAMAGMASDIDAAGKGPQTTIIRWEYGDDSHAE